MALISVVITVLRIEWQGRLLRPLIDGLFYFVQKDHCAQAWQGQRHLYKKE